MKEKEVEKLLKAVANVRRLAIIKYLRKRKDAHVGDISTNIRLSFKATSRHLAVLYAVNILEREQRGLQMHYKISSTLPPLIKHISNSLE